MATGTARFRVEITSLAGVDASIGDGSKTVLTLDGVVDFGADRGSATFTVDGPISVNRELEDGTAVPRTGGEVVWQGDDEWTRVDAPSESASEGSKPPATGTRWTHTVRPAAAFERAGLSLVANGISNGPPPIPPITTLRWLRDRAAPLTGGSPWMIDGLDISKYSFALVSDQLLPRRDRSADAESDPADAVDSVALYLGNDDGRVRRVEMSEPVDPSGRGGDFRLDLSQFGTTVAVSPPPTDQVTDR